MQETLKPGEGPRVVIDIQKQHFREFTYSAMPLADLYNSLPTLPMERARWITGFI